MALAVQPQYSSLSAAAVVTAFIAVTDAVTTPAAAASIPAAAVAAGGLVEPPVVPRFIEALAAAGASAVRVPAYLTTLGLPGSQCCIAEFKLLKDGHIDAIAFSSTAEVSVCRTQVLTWCDPICLCHITKHNVCVPL